MFEFDPAAVPQQRVAPHGPTLPFDRKELNESAAVVVHFKIAESDLQMRQELAQAIQHALKGIRVHGHSIIPTLTNENVEMSAIDARLLCAHLAPYMKQALGIP